MTIRKNGSPLCFAFVLAFLLSFSFSGNAQAKLSDDPDVLFKAGDYLEALDLFLKQEKDNPKDLELQYKIAVCYLNIHDDKSRAVPYFAKCHNAGYGGKQAVLYFGQALLYKYDLTGAKSMFEEYAMGANAKEKEIADLWMGYVKTAKEMIKHPVHVKFENLGKEVNTQWADYYPFVSGNEGALYFTSRRKASIGNDISSMGYYSADIFYSKVVNGQWTKSKNLGPTFNTAEDEECVGLTADGKKMLVYVFHDLTGSDIFSAEYPAKGKNFTKPLQFDEPINTEDGEYEASFTPDGKTIFFSSDRKGGAGEADIYMSHQLPDGRWGVPQLLGNEINTKYKEAFPQISADGKTLYFSSQGHNSMGGFDVFKSVFDSTTNKWSKAENVGYPLNTTDDDMMYSVAANGRDGYISAWKKGGFGDLDIYKVIFTDAVPLLTAVRGDVVSVDTSKKQIAGAKISITDLVSHKEIDLKKIDPRTGHYIFIVSPGKYRIDIHCEGYKDLSNEFAVYDKSDFSVEKNLDFALVPVNYVPKSSVQPKKKPAR